MSAHGVVYWVERAAYPLTDLETPDRQVPAYLAAALQNVYLCRAHTCPPVRHEGEFWHWYLTPYGLTLMRLLTRASARGFAYRETFLEPDPQTVPQLVLLADLNQAVAERLSGPVDWDALLRRSVFLQERRIAIDTDMFARDIRQLIVSLESGVYDLAGNYTYRTPRQLGW